MLDALVRRMLGGDLERFFKRHWRRAPLHVPGAFKDHVGVYTEEDLLRDYARHEGPPYVVVRVDHGRVVPVRCATVDEAKRGLEAGGVLRLQLSGRWHAREVPRSWAWLRDLQARLRESLGTLALGAQSDSVDIYLSDGNSSIGTHFDRVDVFSVNVKGRKRWLVEPKPDPARALRLAREGRFRGIDLPFEGKPLEFILEPGDCLYVPALCLHNVSGLDRSLGLGLGVIALSEVEVLRHVVTGWLSRPELLQHYEPLPTYPPALGPLHEQANGEMKSRVKALMARLLSETGARADP